MVAWLRKLFQLAVTPSEGTVSAYRRPLGYQQITSGTLGSATNLTLPTPIANLGLVPGYAIIQCEGTTSSVRWRDDGTAPTSTIGMILSTGGELDYSGDLNKIQFILATGTPILNISFYA
jgi:hypothetical protein